VPVGVFGDDLPTLVRGGVIDDDDFFGNIILLEQRFEGFADEPGFVEGRNYNRNHLDIRTHDHSC
jgi:hypothetical protein